MADLSLSDGIKRSRSGTLRTEPFHKSSSSEDIRKRSGTILPGADLPKRDGARSPKPGDVSGSELIQAFEKQFLSKDDTDASKLFTPEEMNTLFSKETVRVSKKKKKSTIGSLFAKSGVAEEAAAAGTDVSAQNWDKLDMAKKERRIRALLQKRASIGVEMAKVIVESVPAPLTIQELKDDFNPEHPPLIWPDVNKPGAADMWLELGDDLTDFQTQLRLMHVEKRETEILYYKEWFVKEEHCNFVAIDKTVGPIAVSIEREKKKEGDKGVSKANARVLVRTRETDEWLFVSFRHKMKEMMSEFKALRSAYKNVNFTKLRRMPAIEAELVELEQRMAMKQTLAIGVLYAKAGQTNENQMFANATGSQAFEDFLTFLGDKIDLAGWSKFAGGLDCSGKNLTGKSTIFTELDQFKLLFHVSTYLPFAEKDEQQLERKRHLGNDVVNIIFLDEGSDKPAIFDPLCLTTKFTHVFIVVSPDKEMTEVTGTQHYKVSVAAHAGVEVFGPRLPGPASFPKDKALRLFLLTKIINAQRAAMAAPGIKERIKKTKETFLHAIVKQALDEK